MIPSTLATETLFWPMSYATMLLPISMKSSAPPLFFFSNISKAMKDGFSVFLVKLSNLTFAVLSHRSASSMSLMGCSLSPWN
jgi:hypothetical protein